MSNSGVVAGKGRRRRRLADEGEDGAADTNKDSNAPARPSECESEGETPELASELSEYESAIESADQEETEEGSDTETETGSETESGSETETEAGDYTDEEGLDQERQSGDGEEQPDNEKPDDDEDKKNPAYVPRRGAFYEHDFRQGDEGMDGEEEEPAKETAKPVKKLWQEEGKWSHDRYIGDLQAPKTTEELIAIYGYDIRAADKPPEAPPKRPGSGRGGRREQRFQDFIPRMAVIDTTEDGADTVPNLGGDDFIPYNNRPGRGRGRRGGRGGNSRTVDNYNSRNRQEGGGRFDGPRQDVRNGDGRQQDFPSLQDSVNPKRENQRSNTTYNSLRHEDYHDDRRDRRPEYGNSRGGGGPRRGGYGDADNRGSNSYSQDARRDNGGWREESYNQDRGNRGYNSERGNRGYNQDRGNKDFRQGDNWRSSHGESRNFNRDDAPRRDQRYGGADNSRGASRAGNYGNNTAPPSGKYGQNYNQPQGYSNLKQEFTNTSMKSERPTSQRAPADSMHDGGDINKNVMVSSSLDKGQREKVQTINVTITSTTTEKKSYAKERRAKGAAPPDAGIVGNTQDSKQGVPMMPQSNQYQQPLAGGVKVESSASKRYSSQRQQAIASRPAFTEPPPASDSGGTKLYNPAMPPPPFFPRDQKAVTSAVPPPTVPQSPLQPGVPDSPRFNPTMLPPASVPMQYPLPVSNAGLALPPTAPVAPVAAAVNPALLAAQAPPTQPNLPAGTPIIAAPPFLPAGMIYSGAQRVPPTGQAPPPFPLPMAYTSPPPQAPPPQPQGLPQQPAQGNTQHKVYRGDITYYAPELQQAPRAPAPQKRPKAAIPIIDPQVIRAQKQRERQERAAKPAPQGTESRPADAQAEPCDEKPAQEVVAALPVSVKQEMPSPVKAEAVGKIQLPSVSGTTESVKAAVPAPVEPKPDTVHVAEPKTGALTAGVKQEAAESRLGSALSDSAPAAKDNIVSIVAVDSRPPLTIVQSVNEAPELKGKAGLVSTDVSGAAKSEVTKDVVDLVSKLEIKSEVQDASPEVKVEQS